MESVPVLDVACVMGVPHAMVETGHLHITYQPDIVIHPTVGLPGYTSIAPNQTLDPAPPTISEAPADLLRGIVEVAGSNERSISGTALPLRSMAKR